MVEIQHGQDEMKLVLSVAAYTATVFLEESLGTMY